MPEGVKAQINRPGDPINSVACEHQLNILAKKIELFRERRERYLQRYKQIIDKTTEVTSRLASSQYSVTAIDGAIPELRAHVDAFSVSTQKLIQNLETAHDRVCTLSMKSSAGEKKEYNALLEGAEAALGQTHEAALSISEYTRSVIIPLIYDSIEQGPE